MRKTTRFEKNLLVASKMLQHSIVERSSRGRNIHVHIVVYKYRLGYIFMSSCSLEAII